MSDFQQDPARHLSDLEQVDAVCLRYEDGLRRGDQGEIADHLRSAPASLREQVLDGLLAIQPCYLDPQIANLERNSLRNQFPELAAVIERHDQGDALKGAHFHREPNVHVPAETSAPLSSMANWALGQVVQNYEVIHPLSMGAFGKTYLAQDATRGKQVVLKVAHGLDESRLAGAESRLRKEAEMLEKLDHPGIVGFCELLESSSGPICVMEYAKGASLRALFKTRALACDSIVAIIARIAEAIAAAHAVGIVHRDLEPSNILVDGDIPTILDFGLAVSNQSQSQGGEFAGSLAYMSPEQVRGDSHWLDGRSDIWSVGVLLYEGLCGCRPFAAQDHEQLSDQILFRDPRPPRQINPAISPRLERVILKCLSRKPVDRHTTADDLAQELRRCQIAPGTWRRRVMVAALLLAGGLGLATQLPSFRNPAADLSNAAFANDQQPYDVALTPVILRRQGAELIPHSLSEAGVLPLRPGDGVYFEMEAAKGTHVCLLHVSVDNQVNILQRRAAQTEASAFKAPIEDAFRISAGPEGVETVILLGSRQPIPSDICEATPVLAASERPLHAPIYSGTGAGFASQDWRGLDLKKDARVTMPTTVSNQRMLLEHFRSRCEIVRMVSYGVANTAGPAKNLVPNKQ